MTKLFEEFQKAGIKEFSVHGKSYSNAEAARHVQQDVKEMGQIFNKSSQDNKSQLLDISISDAKHLLHKTTVEIIESIFEELKSIFPQFQIKFVEKYKIIKERNAIFGQCLLIQFVKNSFKIHSSYNFERS